MPIQLRCPGCNKPLKVKEELAGKKVKCPGCGQAVPVPAAEPEMEAVVEEVVAVPPPKPAKVAVTAKAAPKQEPEELEEEELEVEEAPRPKGKAGKGTKGGQKWVPCPKCGAENPKRVMYTFWGSFYGPKLFNHVRCVECGATY